MARLHGYRERIGVDIPIHIAHLNAEKYWQVFPIHASDLTTVIVDIAASRHDITVELGAHGKAPSICISGPWLTGMRTESMIVDMLHIANDAVQEGRSMSAMEVITQLLDGTAKSDKHHRFSVLTPMVVPVRMAWRCDVRLNEGAQPGPVDIWIRTLQTRDVA